MSKKKVHVAVKNDRFILSGKIRKASKITFDVITDKAQVLRLKRSTKKDSFSESQRWSTLTRSQQYKRLCQKLGESETLRFKNGAEMKTAFNSFFAYAEKTLNDINVLVTTYNEYVLLNFPDSIKNRENAEGTIALASEAKFSESFAYQLLVSFRTGEAIDYPNTIRELFAKLPMIEEVEVVKTQPKKRTTKSKELVTA